MGAKVVVCHWRFAIFVWKNCTMKQVLVHKNCTMKCL